MNAVLLLLLVIVLLLLIGAPIGVSIGMGIVALCATKGTTTISFLAQSMYSGLDSFPFIAIPCFMLAGSIMETGGLSKRIVTFAQSLVGNFTGSLGTITVLACMFFGAISGSAPATVAAIGGIMLPHMYEAKYNKNYCAGLIATAGGLGVVIPPSIPMVVWGLTCNVSITDMFLAGIAPGIVIGLSLIVTNWIISKKKHYRGNGNSFSIKAVAKAFWYAKWSLLMPIIILGGIYSGAFTPTEAAVVAIAYGLIIGIFVNKEFNPKDLIRLLDNNTSFVGGFTITFAAAIALGAVFSALQIPAMVTNLLLSISTNKIVLLMIINLVLLVVGMLLDVNSSIIIFGPLLYSVFVTNLGVNPVHLGIIVIVNLCIGFVTPPVGANLFEASSMTKLSMTEIAKAALPFLLALFIALMFITYIPQISLFLL